MGLKVRRKIYQYTAVFEPAEEGGYTVTVPALPGCISEGNTFEEAVAMIQDAIEGYLESLVDHGEPIPEESAHEFVGKVVARAPLARRPALRA